MSLVLVLLLSATLLGQSNVTEARFEAVAIRHNPTERDGGGAILRPGGRWEATNLPVRTLIAIAFEVQSNRVLGGPDWLPVERYDISAVGKAEPTPEEFRQMLQALLRDRFRLSARVEKRDLPIYQLVVARGDRQLGAGIRPARVDCDDLEAAKNAFATVAASGGRIPCGITFGQRGYVVGGSRVSVLEPMLTGASGRPVLDRTGLTGLYDIDLEWTQAEGQKPDGVSIFTAVQEQLGLRLEPSTAPLDVVIVERVERPSQN
jgi:uncharacterized protein (TIGR03435 family)